MIAKVQKEFRPRCMVKIFEEFLKDTTEGYPSDIVVHSHILRIKSLAELQKIYGKELYWSGFGGRVPEQIEMIDKAQYISDYYVSASSIIKQSCGFTLVDVTIEGLGYGIYTFSWPLEVFTGIPNERIRGKMPTKELIGLKKDFK